MTTREALEALDAADPLAGFRELFALPEGVIYLDGNSLGPLPRATPARLAETVTRDWGCGLIRSWNEAGWVDLPRRVGDKIARLVGAPPGSVVAGDSTSVNVFKALAAALALRPDRRVIVSEAGNFPTDLYIAQGLAALLERGHELRLVPPEELPGALRPDVAALLLTQVDYRTGALHDMAAVTRAAHQVGAVTVWDLAHSAGALPVDLDGAEADFAIGCGYKFLNGGPGAPAFFYAAPRLHAQMRLPLSGWFGHAAPFAFETGYRAGAGIAQAMVGTPPILGLVALEQGVDIALRAPLATVRQKSLQMVRDFAALVAQECGAFGFRLVSCTDPASGGSQVSLAHPEGYAIMQALIARGVIGDFRAPDILRFGMTPLYVRHADLWDAVAVLREIMQTRCWDTPEFRTRRAVT
jgi:kynureninase